MSRKTKRARRRNPSPKGFWAWKILGAVAGGAFGPSLLWPLVRPKLPTYPQDPNNPAALEAWGNFYADRRQASMMASGVAGVGSYAATFAVRDERAQAFLVGSAVGCGLNVAVASAL